MFILYQILSVITATPDQKITEQNGLKLNTQESPQMIPVLELACGLGDWII